MNGYATAVGFFPIIPGTVIEGTLQPAPLLCAFLDELKRLNPEEAAEFAAMWHDHYSPGEAVWALMDAINDYAPEGYYFGAHPGDGADFGWWEAENDDQKNDDQT